MFHVEQIKKSENKFIDNCPVCENTKTVLFLKSQDYFLTQEDFNLVQCTACSFIYTNPVPEINSLFQYYDSPDYSSHKLKKANLFNFIYREARKLNLKKKYKIVTNYTAKGSILDVGCGTGELLKYFREKGWKATGIEPVDSARKFASKNYKLNVYPENKLNHFKAEKFDVITLWHVLEHVYNLNERLEQLKRILHADGYLVIAVPNIDSYDSIHYGKYWSALDVPRHLYHFSKETLKKLLDIHSFEVVSIYPMKFDSYYVSLLSERYLKKSLPYISAFYNGYISNKKASVSGNYSSMIFVIKQK